VGRFLKERKALNVIALSANSSVITAWSNDYSYESVFARQVEAHGQEGAILWALSTSGNSENVISAAQKAREMGMATIGLTGSGGGRLSECCDVLIDVPSRDTPRIQELHIGIFHFICEQVESALS
jgi:D-sedoheptulose 7-phosphate isomerase